jgi:hypothetical protein
MINDLISYARVHQQSASLVVDIGEKWCELTESRYLSNGSFTWAKFLNGRG